MKNILVSVLLAALVFSFMPLSSAQAQTEPTEATTPESLPIFNWCKTLWDNDIAAYVVVCPIALLLPLMYGVVNQAMPTPEPPPTPVPDRVKYQDPAGDQLVVNEVCSVNFCDYFGYILFSGITPEQCSSLIATELVYDDGSEVQSVKEPHFISIQPLFNLNAFGVEIKRFTDREQWSEAEHYALTLVCQQ